MECSNDLVQGPLQLLLDPFSSKTPWFISLSFSLDLSSIWLRSLTGWGHYQDLFSWCCSPDNPFSVGG